MLNIAKIFNVLTLGILFNVSISPVIQAADYIQFDEKNISQVKQSIQANNAHAVTKKAYANLLTNADNALTLIPPTVINKTFVPPSNDKNDYLSISRYWWPDPNSSNGLPWIRKDGITNPDTQTDDVDRKRLGKVTYAIRTLSLAYYFSSDEKYATKAIELIDVWFLDKKTKMNPHFTYSQSVPGNPKGRRSGILDGRLIPENVIDAITMLSESKQWTKKRNKKMNKWFRAYLTWLTESKLGKSGSKQTNNHGSWYRFQVASLAWYLGDDALLEKAFNDAKRSFNKQFNAAGAQEHELERTRGFFYSCFNLTALSRVATVADKAELSLWEYKSSKGRSLKSAVNFLMPVARGEAWTHSSKNLDVSYLLPLLGEIMKYQPEAQYEQALTSILADFATKENLAQHQQSVLFEFALFNPKYLR